MPPGNPMNSAPSNSFSRPLALSFCLLIAVAAALWLRPTATQNISHGAQLFLNTPDLDPTTTFEVRFDETLAGPESIGQEATPSPLEILPPLAGKFTWLSRRSGVFTPAEPPALNSTYTIRLRAGLVTADGQPLQATLSQRFTTPPFGFVSNSGYRSYDSNPTNASSLPAFTLTFNADLATNTAPAYFRFVNASGKSVPAVINFGQRRASHRSRNANSETATWADRFPRASTNAQPDRLLHKSDADQMVPLPNVLHVTPARPLPAGPGWKLVVESGLPSADGQFRLAKAESFPIGDVQPFCVSDIRAQNWLNSGREVSINFNKELDLALISSNALDWFEVSPPLEILEAHCGWRNINLAGDFQLGTNYTVTVRAGVPGIHDFTLVETLVTNVVFEPLAPQVYLPTYSGEQLAGGRREFEFLSLNCNEVRVAAKRLPPEQLIHALRGYRSYTQDRWERPAGHALDYNVVPGITTFKQTLRFDNKVDAVVRHSLAWKELLDGKHFGAALVQVEQGDHEARPRREGSVAQSLVQVTDLGLLWKQSDHDTFVWCFSYATGEPVPGAVIKLTTDESEVLATQTTDDTGLAKLPAPEKATWLLAEKDGDVHAAELSGGRLTMYGTGLPYESFNHGEKGERPWRGLMFTERKAYRPGDTVFVKAILRELHDARPTLPEPRPLQLTCIDPQDVESFRTNLMLSALGSVDAAIHLPLAPPGTYRIQLHDTNSNFTISEQITVADYEPNAFNLKLAAKPNFAAGEPVEIPVTASYFMGKSLSNARLLWIAETEDETFAPAGFDDFEFGTDRYLYNDDNQTHSAMTLQGETAFDATGKLTLTPDVPLNPRFPQPRRVNLSVEATDANQQTISEEATFVRHASEFYLGALHSGRIKPAGKPFPVEVVAVNADGNPQLQTASRPLPVGRGEGRGEGQGQPATTTNQKAVLIKLTLKRIEYETLRVEGAGHSISFRNQRADKLVLETNVTTLALTNLGTKWAIAPDAVPPTIQATEPGEHLLEIRAHDSAGRDVLTVIQFDVAAEAETSWSRRSDTKLELVPDQKNYRAGETAHLLVKTPVSGPALVTVERERVLRHFNVELKGNAPVVEIPLADVDAPDIFVSVMMLRGAEKNPRQSKLPDYRFGYCQLNVSSRTTTLDVAVTAARTDYMPGQPVDVAVQINDGFGAPAPDAEVTLYAVDEGVLSLTGYQRPDPHAFFYEAQPIRVSTGLSIDRLEPENPEDVRFENKGFVIGGGGRNDTRKNFLACAFWNATLRTDAAGRVTAPFKAPDNLTRFRVIAVAHTAKQQFGSGESGFNINKPLMVEPSLPRFANIGDEITLRALVHNQSKRAGEVRVELALDDHAVSLSPSDGERAGVRGSPQTISLTPGASSYVEFPVRFTEAGTAKWTWRAKFVDPAAGDFTDAVESTLPVGYPQPLLRETHLARSSGTGVSPVRTETLGRDARATNDGASLDLLQDVNPQLLEGRGTIHVRVANTRLVELSEGVAHLLHYPYGCVEQTCSSLLPWIVLNDFPDVLPPNKTHGLNRDHALQTGFARLAMMETGSGGLSYWPGGDQPMLWASAYGGFVLALADARDLHVPPTLLRRVLEYLKTSLKGVADVRGDEALNERCLALLTLAVAGHPEPAYHEVLFRKRDELSAESRALLALAILKAGGPKEMAAQLLDTKPAVRNDVENWFGCTERETAIRLAALSLLQPKDAEVDKAVAELMRNQKGGRWGTTQGNAWALFALTEYARLVETAAGDARATVSFNGTEQSVALSATQRVAELEYILQSNTPPHLQLNNTGTGKLYTTTTVETRATTAELPRQDRGFSVARRYGLLGTNGTLREFKNAHVGDTVVVTLTIEAHQTSHYVAVDDALPAVFEEVNPAFKSQRTQADAAVQDWFSDHTEIHADRVQFFRDHLPAGRYTITHLARVRGQGEATAPGTKVEEMYHPERFGFSGTEHVSTKAAE